MEEYRVHDEVVKRVAGRSMRPLRIAAPYTIVTVTDRPRPRHPTRFGGYSSELKKALDRSIGVVSPFLKRIDGETHHRKRYERYPAVLGIGVLPGPDPEDEALFRSLVRRNAINLHAPAHAAAVVYHDARADETARAVDALMESVRVTA